MNQIPNANEISRMHFELAKIGARSVGEFHPWAQGDLNHLELVLLAARWSRYDPRLLEVLIDYAKREWSNWNPYNLRKILLNNPDPQTFLVVLNFIKTDAPQDLELAHYCDYVSDGFAVISSQLYFYGLADLGSRLMFKSAEEPVQEFLDWGFLSRMRPVVHEDGKRREIGHWSLSARKNRLDHIVREQKRVTISGYLKALDHCISRPQALLDLKAHPHLKKRGAGRGAFWVMKK